jgi:hypothetical protein
MAYNVKPPKPNVTVIPESTYGAWLCGIGHLGHVENTYEGKTKIQEKVLLTFVIDFCLDDRRLAMVSKDYTWWWDDGGLLIPVIEALLKRPLTDVEHEKGFDIDTLLGKEAMVATKNSKKGWANIATVTRVARGAVIPPKTDITPWFWWLSPDGFNPKAFERVSKFWQDKAMSSPEYQALKSPPSQPGAATAEPTPKPSNDNGGTATKAKAKGKAKPKTLQEFGEGKGAIDPDLNDPVPY